MSKVKEKTNPSIEFKNDPMMREIHENRIKIYEETQNKSISEKIALIKKKAAGFRNQ